MKKWLGQSCALLLAVAMLMNGMAQPVLAQNGNERTAQEQAEYSGGGIEGEAEAAPEEPPNALRKAENGALGEQASPSKAGKKQADSSDVLPDGRVLDDTASPANAGLKLLSLLARSLTGEKSITYRYEAKDAMGRNIPSAEIPQAILGTCPQEENKAVGEVVQAPAVPAGGHEIPSVPYKGRKGKWKFNGWNRQSLTVAEEPEQNVFVGSWTFTDEGFGKTDGMGNQFINPDEQKKMRLGEIRLEFEVNRVPNLSLPNPDPFQLPKTYTITARLSDDQGNERDGFGDSKEVGTGTFVEESREQSASDPNVYTVKGCLYDSYGKKVNLPMFDENGVGLFYDIQNKDCLFRENGKESNSHHRWWGTSQVPNGAHYPPNSEGQILFWKWFRNTYTELVSSEFRSTWLTGMPEAERPRIRAQLTFTDEEGDFHLYVPLLKKNYEDDPENYVRIRRTPLNTT